MTAQADEAPIRVVLVDDHAIVRQGLRTVLNREPDLCVVGEARTVQEATDVAASTRPDVALVDLKLSNEADAEGLEVCAALAGMDRPPAVVVLTTYLDDDLVVAAARSGASGYVIKDVDTGDLVRAVRAVSRGQTAYDPRSAGAIVRSLRQADDRPTLTARERDVLRLLAQGHSSREVGARLYVAETTVKFHVRNVMRKLGATNRAEAVYQASKRGLV